jgi:PAS domain S-box-containing protein
VGSSTILLVDDHEAARRLVRQALERAGMRVIEAEDGESALSMMKKERPQLVIQDLALPDIDGFDLVGRLRGQRAGEPICVLAFSGLISKLDQSRVVAAGFDDVIPKPCDPSTLVSIVESHLPGRASLAGNFGAGKRMVLADDDGAQLMLTTLRLSQLGFEIVEARDGQEALDRIREAHPDVIVSDVMMPRVDGFDLALELRKDPRLAHIPLVLTSSSYVEESDRSLARRAGADEFVLRTPDMRELVEALFRTVRAKKKRSDPPLPNEDLTKQHAERVLRQLERQVRHNAGLMRRCAALSTELSIITRISEAVLKQRNVEAELDDVLSSCFDSEGASTGALYLLASGGALRVRPLGSQRFGAADLEGFFEQREWLFALMRRGTAQVLVDTEEASDECRAVLQKSGAESALVVPLVHMGKVLGALFMAHTDAAHAIDVLQWRVFAQGLSNQITLALTLANAFFDLEAAEREAQEQRSRVREQAERWRALVENAPDIVMNLGRNGEILFINRPPAGRSHEEVMASTWYALAAPDHRETRAETLKAVFATGKPATIESASRTEGGELTWVESHLGPIFTGHEVSGVAVIERDVTQKKQTEAQLIVSDRMASVGTLAAGVAHEINNPLASVMANLDLAVRDTEELSESVGFNGSDLLDQLNDAREAAERVRRIVKDLKIFSRVDDDKRDPVDVERVLESTLRMAWNEVRHRARLVKDYQKVPLVEANESRLGQVFLNLLVNAAQAIEEGNASRNEIRVRTYVDAQGWVVVSIADTGTGIPESLRARLFTPFVTTKPAGVGTGLGLSICHRIVSSLGGRISVDSEVGRGSEFKVFLPQAKPDSVVPEPRSSPPTVARRRARVLVVDDEPLITKVVRRTLGREHDVEALNSAEEALVRIRAGERFDVILCDLMMPQVTGMDFHAELLRAFPDQASRMVFLSGGAFTKRARDFLESVQNHRVEKPVDAQGLKALINDMLR